MVFFHFSIITIVMFVSVVAENEPDIGVSQNKSGLLYESKTTLKSFEKALEYLEKRPESLTRDVVLGVLIAKANLKWIINKLINHGDSNFWTYKLVELLRECDAIINLNKFKDSFLTSDILWKSGAGNLKYGILNQGNDDFVLPEFNSCQSIDAYMMNGTPEDSDFCMKELLSSRCKVSEYCWFSETNGNSHSGYKTTHRLLYFLTAFKMKCQEINSSKFSQIRSVKEKLCEKILWETKALFKKPNFSVVQDLLMEQIALCGFEGYEEFAPRLWRDQVRKWQDVSGCFGTGVNFKNCSVRENNSRKRGKKSDLSIEGCHTHVTAVAVAALAFFTRVTLKALFSLL